MSWKEIKPDASGVLTLFVGGAGLLLLTFLSLPGDRIRLARGGPTVSRAAHPVLYWACEVAIMLVGVLLLVAGVWLLRTLIRERRHQERNLEQEAIDSFVRDHPGAKGRSTNDKHPNN